MRGYQSLIPGAGVTGIAVAIIAWEILLTWTRPEPVWPTGPPIFLGLPGLFMLYVGFMIRGWRCLLILSGLAAGWMVYVLTMFFLY